MLNSRESRFICILYLYNYRLKANDTRKKSTASIILEGYAQEMNGTHRWRCVQLVLILKANVYCVKVCFLWIL